LQADLIELQKSVSDVNACVNIFAEMVTAMASTEDLTSTVCLTRFKNLISTYETMFERASVFNNTLADLYFNYILKDGNPDVFSKGVDAFEVDVVVNKLQSRLCYQKSCLSQCFVEMYVGSNLAEQIGNGATTLDITSNKYKDNIEAINDVITEETAVEKAQQNKNAFYELAVQAQNIQATIKNDTNKFITAVDKIEFCEVVVDANATAYDKLCAEIISSHNELIKDYNAVLVKMLEIII